jgi:subtilisin family serine protease
MGASYTVPAYSIPDLANDATVRHVSVDHKLAARNDYAVAATNAAVAWNTYGATGKGIGIAIIDSGISPHQDVASAIVYSQDFTGGDSTDAYGHEHTLQP